MKRADFDHVIRAAAAIARDEIVVVGSQAILGEHPNASAALLVSYELDVYPKNYPERAIDIDGALGDGSPFRERYGYYAQGVGPETVVAPAGWQTRLIRLEIPATLGGIVVAWCMSTHDVVLAKLAAGRPHDFEFAEEAVRSHLVDPHQLRLGVELMPMSHQKRTGERLERILRVCGL